MDMPKGLQDALDAALQAKADADESLAARQIAAASLVKAEADDDAAAKELADKTAVLAQRRAALEAVEDAYLQVGAPAPASPF